MNPLVLGSLRRGGIPVVSERLLSTLKKLGTQGETADVIYRGHNKAAYDTVQKGFKRFLVEPQFKFDEYHIDTLPKTVPNDFDFCCLLRSRWGGTWYDLALSFQKAEELLRLRRSVFLDPLFRNNGVMHNWLKKLDSDFEELGGEKA